MEELKFEAVDGKKKKSPSGVISLSFNTMEDNNNNNYNNPNIVLAERNRFAALGEVEYAALHSNKEGNDRKKT